MAKKHEPIPDELLLAKGVWALDPRCGFRRARCR